MGGDGQSQSFGPTGTQRTHMGRALTLCSGFVIRSSHDVGAVIIVPIL